MELTGRDFDLIPHGNVRVPVATFARLWLAAEELYDRELTWSAFGVVMTCRWLATATVRSSDGRTYLAPAPITRRSACAIAETIEPEALAAAKLLDRRPVPTWLEERPGWLLAIHQTFEWAWYRSGNPPIEVPTPASTQG
ncbi:hypothetical protein AB0C38_43520 [Amycolatopsis sp. NPDC048633]|uniref:hypothetical protein n=1 Tax=Amycolatopsis sp. NPDC048633 TaxID=3157095 RepID=UPI00340B8EFC